MAQSGVSYDSTTNKARVRVTITPTNAVDPWRYVVAVRGTTVVSGSVTGSSVAVTITNDCSITTQSVTSTITDAQNRTASAASTLDRSLCPPPPDYPHARDHIIAGPTLTEDSFVDRLRAVSSPALSESRYIYRTLVAGGVNPAFSLGTFHAESHSGTRGYATYTKNWGNILYYAWTADFGATPYAPGNGYTYAKFPTWLASVRAYVDLLQRYDRSGYTTVSSASAHWLGTIEGSTRHLTYLNNITAVMSILPDDGVPVMTALSVATYNRASVPVSYAARDNLAVTGYQIGKKRGATGAWSYETTTSKSTTLTLVSGWWTIAVRATDAAVGDEPVDRPARGGRRGERGVDTGAIADVAEVRVAAHPSRNLLELVQVRRQQRERGAFTREPLRDRLADPPSTTGDDHVFARQCVHPTPFFRSLREVLVAVSLVGRGGAA